MRQRNFACWAIAVILWTSSTAVQAQDHPLEFISQDVSLVIRVHEPDMLGEKVGTFVDKIQGGVKDMVTDAFPKFLGALIQNPELIGVDHSRDTYVAIYAQKDSDPVIVYAVPAIRSSDLVGALDVDMTTQVEGNWVLYTASDAIPDVTSGLTVTQLMDESFTTRLLSQDVSVFVNSKQLMSSYHEDLLVFKDKAIELMEQIRFSSGEIENIEQMITMYTAALNLFEDYLKQSEIVVIGATLTSQELKITTFDQLVEGGRFANFLAANQQSRFDDLSSLPPNAMGYFGASGQIGRLLKSALEMSQSEFQKRPGTEPIDYAKLFQQIDESGIEELIQSFQFNPGTPAPLSQTTLLKLKSIDKYRDYLRTSTAEFDSVGHGSSVVQTFSLQAESEEVGGLPVDVITVKSEFDPEQEDALEAKVVFDYLFGGNEMTTRTAYLGDRCVQFVGPKSQFTSIVTGLQSNRKTRAGNHRGDIMPESNLLALVNGPAVSGTMLKLTSKMEAFPFKVPEAAIDNLGLSNSYMGFAVGSEGRVLKTELRIPVEQFIGYAKLGVLVSGSVMQSQQFE